MDTGAPMDTAESKVIKNIVCWPHQSQDTEKSNLLVFYSVKLLSSFCSLYIRYL